MQPDAPGDGRHVLKLCVLFVATLALCHTDPHVGGVKQTKIIIFYEEPERYQAGSNLGWSRDAPSRRKHIPRRNGATLTRSASSIKDEGDRLLSILVAGTRN